MQTVQNISDIKYFLHQFEKIDDSYDYTVKWTDLKIQTNYLQVTQSL